MRRPAPGLRCLAPCLTALVLAACGSRAGPAPPDPTGTAVAPGTSQAAESAVAPVVKTLYVGPEWVDCAGEAPQQCLQVKETADAEWQTFYGEISGFDYEPSYTYELRVAVSPVANPPADGSSLSYQLLEVVDKSAAAPTTSGSSGNIEGAWTLLRQGPATHSTPVPEGLRLTARFADGQVSGQAGCSTFDGPYTVDGRQLAVGPLAATPPDCSAAERLAGQAYLQALSTAKAFGVREGLLTIDTGAGEALVFAAQAAAPLDGSAWSVTYLDNGQGAVLGLVPGTAASLVFADGDLTGNAGCNDFHATYSLDGDAITITPPGSTRQSCDTPPGVMAQEAQLLAALDAARRWRIDGDTLELRTADDALALSAQLAVASR